MLEFVSHSRASMGGTVNVVVAARAEEATSAGVAACRTGDRIDAWASRLTRFDPTSDLSRLNGSGDRTEVRPTLGAALEWAKAAQQRSAGLVDACLLDARLAAKSGESVALGNREWSIHRGARSTVIQRSAPFALDLDGFAKGWLADRAANLLRQWPGAAVDADGDVAITAGPGVEWLVAVNDPTAADSPLATLRLVGGSTWTTSYGVATSGTSVHRWHLDDGSTGHHLIDPRTRRPADTDIVQATVVAPTAREAEVLAKSAVILGSAAALGHLANTAALAAILLIDTGEVVALPGIERWLA